MIEADTAQPFADQFAALRAEAVANLEAIRVKRANDLRSAAELAVLEDQQLTTLAKLERFACGDFTLAGTVN